MTNKYASGIIFLTLCLLSGSCKKELNVFPTTSAVDGNVITDEQSARVVLNGVYSRFANTGFDHSYSNHLSTFWTDENENLPSELAGSLRFPGGLYDPLYEFTFDPAFNFVDSIWKYGYKLVNAANGFLKNVAPVTSIPAAAKEQMIAEAKFLRAFGNAELLFYYGQYNDPSSQYGIILRDEFVTTSNIDLPRSSVAAAYTSILADLDVAIKGLPVLNSAICYANASAAKLLRARVLMNRGTADDHMQVISLTNDIITNGPFALEDSLKDIFLSKGFSSKEVMLGIQPYPNESWKMITQNVHVTSVVTDSLIALLVDDARKQWIYKNGKVAFWGSVIVLTKYFSGDPVNPVPTPLSADCYAFRLSEAYLLEAEAITLSGGDLASARSLLTTVMSHAGAGAQELAAVANATTPAAMQVEIVKENMRNFVAESGVDWFALRRLPFKTMQQLNPNITDAQKLIFPIPVSELMVHKVIQNPGY